MNGSCSEMRRDPFQGGTRGPLSAQEQSRSEAYFRPPQPGCAGPAVRAKTLQSIIFYNGKGGMWALQTGQILN